MRVQIKLATLWTSIGFKQLCIVLCDMLAAVPFRLMDTGSLAKAAAQHVWHCDRTGVSCRHYVCRHLFRHQLCVIIYIHALFLFTDLLTPLQPRLGLVLSYSYNSNQFLISFMKRSVTSFAMCVILMHFPRTPSSYSLIHFLQFRWG